MSELTGRQLIKEILECEDIDIPIECSVDISTGEHDSCRRVFTDEFFEINDKSAKAASIMLLFSGSDNKDVDKPAPDIEKAVDKIAEIEAKLQTAIEGAIDDTISIYSNVLLSDLLKVKSLLTEGGE